MAASEISLLSNYSPQTQSAARRSKYLAEALKAMQEQSEPIRSPVELVARLGAAYLTKRSADKADAALIAALKADKESVAKPALDWLSSQGNAPPAAADAGEMAPGFMPQPPATPVEQAPLPAPQAGVKAPQLNFSSKDMARKSLADALGRDVTVTSAMRTPQDTARLRARGYPAARGGAHEKGLAADVLALPGMTLDQTAAALNEKIPGIQAAPHKGRLGVYDHVHVLQGAAPAAAQDALPAVASAGMAQPPQPPPMAPQGAQQPPARPQPRQPTPQQIQIAQDLLANPLTRDQGIAYVQKLRQELAEAPKFETYSQNGVTYFYDPYTRQTRPAPVGPEARNITQSGRQLNLPGDPNAAYSVDPFGKPTPINPAPSGFGYGEGGGMRALQGGPQDPRSPMNALSELRGVRQELKSTIDAATQIHRNYNAVQAGYKQQNGAGDIAMINGLQRLIDEGVVREGDVALQLRAQGLEGSLASMIGYVQSGGVFSPDIRQRILRTATAIHTPLNQTYRDRVMPYRGIVERTYGHGAFEDVLPSTTVKAFGWDGSAPPDAEPSPAPAGPPSDADRQRGLRNLQTQGYAPAQAAKILEYSGQTGPTPKAPRNQAEWEKLQDGEPYIDTDGLVKPKRGRR